MTANLYKLWDGYRFRAEDPQSTTMRDRQLNGQRRVGETSAVAAKDVAGRVVAFPSLQAANLSRRIDWYANSRSLPPLIARFLDTRWRQYALRCFLIDGEDSEIFRETVDTMKDLAWSVRPKKDLLSHRRLVELIPPLYERLQAGLESLSLGLGTPEHDAFFAELAKLHQAALNPSDSAAQT